MAAEASRTNSVVLDGAAAMLRQETTQTKGLKALWANMKVFYIALFASFGGLMYGYQQGVLGQALVMHSFTTKFPGIAESSGLQGWLTSVLQLGGWAGALSSGFTSEIFSRKHTIFAGALWCILGSYLTAGAATDSYLFAGRFFTGIGVGILSATGPLYNAELAPPELRGLLVSLQQFATTVGIMLAYWIAYGTNYIGGTGEGQSDLAWRVPLIVQGIPGVILAIGVWFLPYSPRLLVNKGKEQEAKEALSFLRSRPIDDPLVEVEFLEIKAEQLFEDQAFEKRFPNMAAKSRNSPLFKEILQYAAILQKRDSFKRVAIACLVMFFQQWSGIDSIIYYAAIIFKSLGLSGNTSSLLATGIVGVINVATTIPAILVIDKLGRRPLLLASSIGMCLCQIIVGVIVAKCQDDWKVHTAAGWAAVVMIWLYIVNFAYGWGPVSWTLIAEIFPLSIRAKGTALGASSNWMNNFIIALITPRLLASISWGLYIFFAAWLALGIVFIYFFIPETKGKTLEEMDHVFGSNTSQEDTEIMARIQTELGLTRALGFDSEISTAEKLGANEIVHTEV